MKIFREVEGIEETDEKEPVSRISEKEGKEQETKLPPVIELPGEVAEPAGPEAGEAEASEVTTDAGESVADGTPEESADSREKAADGKPEESGESVADEKPEV